jgi:hypothetical protein
MAIDWVLLTILFLSLAKWLNAIRNFCDLSPPQEVFGYLGRGGMVHDITPIVRC